MSLGVGEIKKTHKSTIVEHKTEGKSADAGVG